MGKKDRKIATQAGLPLPEVINPPPKHITREEHLRSEIAAIREATEKEVNAVVERARKATMPISGAAATQIGQNKRAFDAKLATLRLARDGRARSAETAYNAAVRQAKDVYNAAVRDAEKVFAEARDAAVDVEHEANAPIEAEMRQKVVAIEDETKRACQEIADKATVKIQPLVDELKKIEAAAKVAPTEQPAA